jgi:predicted peptidase
MIAVRLLALLGAAVFVLTPTSSPARAAETKTGFLDRVHKDADGKVAKYVLFVPHGYKGDKAYPLILFLHGSGETGTDGKKQATVGLAPAIKKREKEFPFFAVFPQSQKRTWRANTDDGKRALAILEEVEKEYKIDGKRIYLTGLSMGGFGTWDFAFAKPNKWAAIVPICGGGDPSKAAKIKGIPCWCFHGDADKAVKVEFSRKIIAALKEAGADPKYTEYPDVGHNSWDKAYATKELYEWLLKQHK